MSKFSIKLYIHVLKEPYTIKKVSFYIYIVLLISFVVYYWVKKSLYKGVVSISKRTVGVNKIEILNINISVYLYVENIKSI